MDLSVGDAVEHYRPADRTAATVSEVLPSDDPNLADRAPSFQQPKELVIRRVIDPKEFRKTAHPAIGPLTTQLRRNAFERMRALLSQPSARTRDYVAWLNGTPVGAIEVFLGSTCAGIHGLTVPERYQGRGIASA